jgi:hypothetical protein
MKMNSKIAKAIKEGAWQRIPWITAGVYERKFVKDGVVFHIEGWQDLIRVGGCPLPDGDFQPAGSTELILAR